MTARASFYTAEQFDAFVNECENVDKRFEFIGGEAVEKRSSPRDYRDGAAGVEHQRGGCVWRGVATDAAGCVPTGHDGCVGA